MKEYVATFKTASQISPDDFAVYNPSLKVTDETTIKHIREWFEKCGGNEKHFEVKIICLDYTH